MNARAVGARAEGGAVLLWVESGGAAAPSSGPGEPSQLEPDGGAAHGTGLRLVSQIAAAHGGEARFSGGSRGRTRSASTSALGRPKFAVSAGSWRLQLEGSTTSPSTSVRRPTPARASCSDSRFFRNLTNR